MSCPTERTFLRPDGTVDWLWSTRAFTCCYNWVWNEKEDTYWGGFEKAQLFRMRDIEQQFPPRDQDGRERERIIPGDFGAFTVSSVIPARLSPHHSSLSISRWKINNLFRQALSHWKPSQKDLLSFTRHLPPFWTTITLHLYQLYSCSHLESLTHSTSFFLRHVLEVRIGKPGFVMYSSAGCKMSFITLIVSLCLWRFRPEYVSRKFRADWRHIKLDSWVSLELFSVTERKCMNYLVEWAKVFGQCFFSFQRNTYLY